MTFLALLEVSYTTYAHYGYGSEAAFHAITLLRAVHTTRISAHVSCAPPQCKTSSQQGIRPVTPLTCHSSSTVLHQNMCRMKTEGDQLTQAQLDS